MDAFIYCADIYCPTCAAAIKARLDAEGKTPATPENESSFDSDEYPKGPFDNGGGEADCPQHCGGCRVFLENPLTRDGVAYTADAIRAFDQEGDGAADVIALWRDFYADEVRDYNESLWDEGGSTYGRDMRRGEPSDDLGESPDY